MDFWAKIREMKPDEKYFDKSTGVLIQKVSDTECLCAVQEKIAQTEHYSDWITLYIERRILSSDRLGNGIADMEEESSQSGESNPEWPQPAKGNEASNNLFQFVCRRPNSR